MNTDEQKIEKYLSKNMTTEELVAFENELKENPELASEIKTYQRAIRTVRNHELLEEMKIIHEEVIVNQQSHSKRTYYYISGIAASLLLIFAVAYIFYFKTPVSEQELYISYFEPYPNLEKTSRGDEDDLKKALEQYSLKNYEEALKLFNALSDNDFEKERISFYSGISLMILNKNSEAINRFKSIPNNSLYEQQLNWYLGLAYLKSKDKPQTKRYLIRIQSGEFKFEEAQYILEMLE